MSLKYFILKFIRVFKKIVKKKKQPSSFDLQPLVRRTSHEPHPQLSFSQPTFSSLFSPPIITHTPPPHLQPNLLSPTPKCFLQISNFLL